MNERLLDKDVQDFLDQNLDQDLDRLIFRGSPFPDLSIRELAEQIESKRKCKTKLPTWFGTPGIIFPPKISIEQASSEPTARYKASLISGKRLADLSGGFGVDAYFFGLNFERVTYVEVKEELLLAARHNFDVLGADNISCFHGDGIAYLRDSNSFFDWIYLDPARRDAKKERVFMLEDCSPNILDNLDVLLSKADGILLKLSPLLDITRTVMQLKEVTEIHVVALENEVKELLFLIRKETQKMPVIHAVNIKNSGMDLFSAELNGSQSDPNYGPVDKYLYEPNAAILKAGLFNPVANEFNLTKVHPNSHLYSSEELIDFPGRRFVVVEQLKYNPKKIKKELGLTRANVTTRNFHESVASIRKRTGLREGGDDYLFFTTDHKGRALVLLCSKAD